MAQKRIDEFDIIKGIAIIAVMYVHIEYQYVVNIPGITFHLSAFFAVSGILMYNKEISSLKQELKKNFNSILIPYFILSAVYIIFSALMLSENSVIVLMYKTLSGLGIGTLWFFPPFFIARCIFMFLHYKNYRIWKPITALSIIPICFISEILCKNNIIGHIQTGLKGIICNEVCLLMETLVVLSLMAIGVYIWDLIEYIQKFKYKYLLLIFVALLFAFINLFCFKQELYMGNDLRLAKINNAMGYIICVVSSTLSLFCISKILVKCNIIKKIISYFGKNSIIIMTTHLEYKVVLLAQYITCNVFGMSLIGKILTLPILCLIEVGICFIVNHTPIKKIYGK